jgi:hypothetical protein
MTTRRKQQKVRLQSRVLAARQALSFPSPPRVRAHEVNVEIVRSALSCSTPHRRGKWFSSGA